MTTSKTKTWMWIQNNRLFKAVVNMDTGLLTVYAQDGSVILKRSCLTQEQLKVIQMRIAQYCGKSFGDPREPFTRL